MKNAPGTMPGALCVRYGASSIGTAVYRVRSGVLENNENRTPRTSRTLPRHTAWLYSLAQRVIELTGMAMQRSGADSTEEEVDQRLTLRPRVTDPTRRHRERVQHPQKRPRRHHHIELPYRTGLDSRTQE